ncbi:MAG: L,D-transpeptidase family protein [Halanaerobiaceae bacterium]
MKKNIYLILLITSILILPIQTKAQVNSDIQENIWLQLSSTPLQIDDQRLHAEDILIEHYREQNFEPHWITDDGILPVAETFLSQLENSPQEGLIPDDYNITLIEKLVEKSNDQNDLETLSKIELLLTNSFLIYISDIHRGRFDYTSMDRIWVQSSDEIDYTEILEKINRNNISDIIKEIEPKFSGYEYLKNKLKKYQEIKENNTWQEAEIQSTMEDLELSPEELIAKIKLNMDRLRWAAIEPDSDYILVNLPDYTLQVRKNDEIKKEMKTVIGRPDKATPVFSEEIYRIILNPVWRIPRSIIIDDYLPQIQENTSFLNNEYIQIYERNNSEYKKINPEEIKWDQISKEDFDYHFWQDSGPWNSLGNVIFRNPDHENIYLHDSPERHLFYKDSRAYSYGCIRVERALELAHYILNKTDDYSKEEINNIVSNQKETLIELSSTFPLHLVYLTTWVDKKNEKLNLIEDIYQRDEELLENFID